jgi:serine/threonine protein kinase
MLTALTATDPAAVGRYRLQGRLGTGGMGTVYLGFDPGGRPAAVKVIRSDLVDDVEFRDRFRREVAAARRVRGSFVAQVLDAGVDEAPPWMATEYVDGVSLSAAVAKRGRLDGAMLADVAGGLANALVSVHAAGLVHRDVKPSNILLSWDGPKIIDFGIARALDGTVHTGTGDVLGSVAWMAPEQLRGERAGPAADVFAWAMCVVFAARGRHPFPAETPAATAIRMLQDDPDLAEVPEHLIPLLARALDKDPARRPSAVETVSALVGADVTDLAEAEDATRRAVDALWSSPAPPPVVPPTSPPVVLPTSPAVVPPASRLQSRDHRRVRRARLVATVAALVLLVGAGSVLLARLGAAPGDGQTGTLGPEPTLNAAAKVANPSTGPAPTGTATSPGQAGPSAPSPASPGSSAVPGATASPSVQAGGAPAAAPTPNTAPNQAAPAPPPPPPTAHLIRYNNGPDHTLLTGPPPPGYWQESVLGSAYQTGDVPGTRPLYACQVGSDSFTSLLATCEGQQVVGVLGWIYDSPPPTPATNLIIRCNTGHGDHFVSLDQACEGRTVEGPLGYVIAG